MIKFIRLENINVYTKEQFEKRRRKALRIFAYYAAEAMRYFIAVQYKVAAETKGEFWTNHTFNAAAGFLAGEYQRSDAMGLRFSNTTWYAASLEFGYEGRFASFPTMLGKFAPVIIKDLKHLYGDRS